MISTGRSGRSNMNVAESAQQSKDIEQPEDDYHYHHDIEDPFDLTIHGDVVVDEPQQDPGDDESDDNC
jgi:hypothetical protein